MGVRSVDSKLDKNNTDSTVKKRDKTKALEPFKEKQKSQVDCNHLLSSLVDINNEALH